MVNNFPKFIEEFIPAVKDKIVNITEFGSDKGETYPELSDIDLFIITKHKSDRHYIFKIARKLELRYLGTQHSFVTDLLQKYLFMTNDFSGVHLIIMGQEEFTANFEPKSFRLKFLTTFFMSRAILLFNIKHKHRLVYGEELSDLIHISKLKLSDRLIPFVFTALALIPLPLIIFNKPKFNIWCFKILKYHSGDILAYAQIYFKNPKLEVHDLNLHHLMTDLANKYRYHPNLYPGSRISLYLKTWGCIISNLNFIWSGPTIKPTKNQ